MYKVLSSSEYLRKNNNYAILDTEFAKVLPVDMATLINIASKLYPMKSERDIKKLVFGWVYNQNQQVIKSIRIECEKTWNKKIAIGQRITDEMVAREQDRHNSW